MSHDHQGQAQGGQYYHNKQLFVRAGYVYPFSGLKDLDGLQGLTLGLGYRYKGWQVDFAYQPMGSLGAPIRATLTAAF